MRSTPSSAPSVLGPVLLLMLLAVGCTAIPPCPARGGPAWHGVTTPHFAIQTDASPEQASRLADELETLREALLVAAWRTRNQLPTGRVLVLLVDGRFQWNEYFTPEVGGFFSSRFDEPTIVLPTGAQVSANHAIKHELVHYLSQFYLREQPAWLAEGLATYFETATYDRAARKVTVGEPSAAYALALERLGSLSVAELIRQPHRARHEDSDSASRFYASSWLLVHYLLNTHPESFARYQLALQAGRDGVAGFRELLWPSELDMLDDELATYQRAGTYYIVSRPFAPPPPARQQRQLTDAEAHVARASLRLFSAELRPNIEAEALAQARAELAEALREAPELREALRLKQAMSR